MVKKGYSCDCNLLHSEYAKDIAPLLPKEEKIIALAEFFKILGDRTKCKILAVLDKREMCVCDIAFLLGVSKSLVSHSLAKLKLAGIVKNRKCGKSVFYSLDDNHVKEIFNTTLTHISHKEKKNEK